MPKFEVRQSGNLNLASTSGLVLIGQCCEAAQVDRVVDPWLPVSQGMKTSDLDELSIRLLERTEALITPYKGDVRFEIGTFVMDNSDTKKGKFDTNDCGLRLGAFAYNCLCLLGQRRWWLAGDTDFL